MVLFRYKDEAGSGFGKQYVATTNAHKAIQMVLISESANLFFDKLQTMCLEPDLGGMLFQISPPLSLFVTAPTD